MTLAADLPGRLEETRQLRWARDRFRPFARRRGTAPGDRRDPVQPEQAPAAGGPGAVRRLLLGGPLGPARRARARTGDPAAPEREPRVRGRWPGRVRH